jgi:hypothetical protein
LGYGTSENSQGLCKKEMELECKYSNNSDSNMGKIFQSKNNKINMSLNVD